MPLDAPTVRRPRAPNAAVGLMRASAQAAPGSAAEAVANWGANTTDLGGREDGEPGGNTSSVASPAEREGLAAAAAASAKPSTNVGPAAAAGGAIIGGVVAGPLWPLGAVAGAAVAYTGVVGGPYAMEILNNSAGSEEPSTSGDAALRDSRALVDPEMPISSLRMISPTVGRDSGVILTRDQLDVVVLYIASNSKEQQTPPSKWCNGKPGLLWSILSLLNVVGTVLGPAEDNGDIGDGAQIDLAMKVVAARYLACILILDSIAFLVGRIALLEVIWLGGELGYSVVYLTLVLTSIEAAVEFVSSAAVPLLYRFAYGESEISLHRLTLFAVGAYFASACAGIFLYSGLGVVVEVLGVRTQTVFLLFAVAQIVQYPLMNQLGDQAVEMALPHWLSTFQELVLAVPGVPLSKRSACCGTRQLRRGEGVRSAVSSIWRKNILAYANGDSLAYFVTLLRFIYTAMFGLIYLAVSGNHLLRWVVLVLFAAVSVYATGAMLKGFSIVKAGIEDNRVDQNHAPTPWPWQMKGSEISLVIFATIIFSVPGDAVTAAVTVLYGSLGAKVSIMVLVGGILVILFVVRKMSHAGSRSPSEDGGTEMRSPGKGLGEDGDPPGALADIEATNSLQPFPPDSPPRSEALLEGGGGGSSSSSSKSSDVFDVARLNEPVDYHPLYLKEIQSGKELGFAGYLSANDQRALDELSKRVLSDEELDIKELAAAMAVGQESWNIFLCRWLRARNFDVDQSFTMLKDHIAWRVKENVTAIGKMTADEVLGCSAPEICKRCPHWVQGFDHQNRPYLFNALGSLDADNIVEGIGIPDLTRLHIWEQEQLTKLCGLKTAETGYVVDRWVTVIDLRGVRMSQFTGNCRALQKSFIAVDQANYPERNGSIFIINAPMFFPVVFAFVQPLMNSRTAARIKIISQNSAARRLLLENLDPEHLLPEYGGSFEGDRDSLRCSGCTNSYMKGGGRRSFSHDNAKMARTEIEGSKDGTSTFARWLVESVMILSTILVSGFLLFWASVTSSKSLSQLLLFICCICLVPYFSLVNDLKSRFEAVLMLYTEGQASGIVYYRNLVTVVFKAPILIINWYVLQAMSAMDDDTASTSLDDDEAEERYEQRQSAFVLAACVALVLACVLYFVFLDYYCGLCGENRSASRFVDQVVRRARARARANKRHPSCQRPPTLAGDTAPRSS